MFASGWSAAGGVALLSPAMTAAIFSRQAKTLIFSRRTPNRFIKLSKFRRSYCPCSCTFDSHGSRVGGITSSELVEREYADLNLKELSGGKGQIGHVRIRQHVNPLSSSFSVPVQAPDWDDVFKDSKLPLMVDIGSGSGRFLIWLAKRFPDSKNHLGLEIRHKLVQRCQFWVKELSLRNIHFISSNAMISFEGLVSSYQGPLVFVSILCPDPHFKRKHHKRRVMQNPLVDSILKNLTTGGQVFMQSDVVEVAMDMRSQLELRPHALKHIDAIDATFSCDPHGWLHHNPLGIRTEREIHAELEGAKIYRRLYQKI